MPRFEINNIEQTTGAQNYQMRWVDLDDIAPDPNNHIYSMDGIDRLAESIQTSGLLQPPMVRPLKEPEDGRHYMIISGHRRISAVRKLYEDGNSSFKKIQVLVDNDQDLISIGIKLLDANAENRVLSNGEMLRQAIEMTRLLKIRKKQENIPGKVRDMVAKRLGVSSGNVGELMAIEKNLIYDFKNLFISEKITKSAAVELSKLPEYYQKGLYEHIKQGKAEPEAYTVDYIKRFKENAGDGRSISEATEITDNQTAIVKEPEKVSEPDTKQEIEIPDEPKVFEVTKKVSESDTDLSKYSDSQKDDIVDLTNLIRGCAKEIRGYCEELRSITHNDCSVCPFFSEMSQRFGEAYCKIVQEIAYFGIKA